MFFSVKTDWARPPSRFLIFARAHLCAVAQCDIPGQTIENSDMEKGLRELLITITSLNQIGLGHKPDVSSALVVIVRIRTLESIDVLVQSNQCTDNTAVRPHEDENQGTVV